MDARLIHGSLGPPKSSTHCQFFAFFKMIPYGEIFKILFRKFSSWHWSMCCVQIREIWPTENQWNRAFFIYLTKNEKKISPGSPAARTALKICHGQPQTMYSECSWFHRNWFTFGGVIYECVNTVTACSKVSPVFGWRLGSSRIKNWTTVGTPTYPETPLQGIYFPKFCKIYSFWSPRPHPSTEAGEI